MIKIILTLEIKYSIATDYREYKHTTKKAIPVLSMRGWLFSCVILLTQSIGDCQYRILFPC